MIVEKIKRTVREQRLEENNRAATEKNTALLEYMCILNGIDTSDDVEEEVLEDE